MNRMRNKTTNTLKSELRKLTSKPLLTIDEFEKLIPMLISEDKEVVRLGVELFKTYDYESFPRTVLEICLCCNISSREFDAQNVNKNIVDNYCSKKLNYAKYKDLFLPF